MDLKAADLVFGYSGVGQSNALGLVRSDPRGDGAASRSTLLVFRRGRGGENGEIAAEDRSGEGVHQILLFVTARLAQFHLIVGNCFVQLRVHLDGCRVRVQAPGGLSGDAGGLLHADGHSG